MKVAIVGSRSWKDHEMVRDYISSLDVDDVVVSGGARGVDQFAEIYAAKQGLETIVFPADWKTYGKRAGVLRNRDIIDAADRVVAFWDGSSAGTKSSIELARKANKPVLVLRPSSLGTD